MLWTEDKLTVIRVLWSDNQMCGKHNYMRHWYRFSGQSWKRKNVRDAGPDMFFTGESENVLRG